MYAAVAAAPGPNTFAVGAQAALRGARATLPLCAGIAVGALLAALGGCAGASALGADERAQGAARALAAGALLALALRLAAPPPNAVARGPRRAPLPPGAGAFGLGLFAAVTNPVTWVYFSTACLGPAGRGWGLVVAGAGAVALLNAVLLAALLGRPGPRAWAERHQARLRLGAGALLGGYAGWAVAPLLIG